MNIGYRPCDVGLFPAFHDMYICRYHSLVMKALSGKWTQLSAHNVRSCFPAFSTIPISLFFIQRIFHSLVSTLFLLAYSMYVGDCVFTLPWGKYQHQFCLPVQYVACAFIVIYMATRQPAELCSIHGVAKVSVASALFHLWSVLQRRRHK